MVGYVVIAVVVLAVLYAIATYNRLVRQRNLVREGWSGIDVQLRRRADLVPNLVETVKGYAGHERGTLEAVVHARQAAVSAATPAEQAAAENQLTSALRQVFALAEAYPDLKANQNFLQLQSELADLENKIAAARRFFNNATAEFNASVEQFPAVLFARSLGFSRREFFELEAGERAAVAAAPQVKF